MENKWKKKNRNVEGCERQEGKMRVGHEVGWLVEVGLVKNGNKAYKGSDWRLMQRKGIRIAHE